MKFRHNYGTDKNIVDVLGGQDAWDLLADFANPLQGAECPFCGGSPHITLTDVYRRPAVKIECDRCYCGTMLMVSGAHPHFDADGTFSWKPVTIEGSLSDALNRWNRRTKHLKRKTA